LKITEETEQWKTKYAEHQKLYGELEARLKAEEKMRTDLETELSKKAHSPLSSSKNNKPVNSQLSGKPYLSALGVDLKKPLALVKNNPSLTERTTNSSSHLKDEYSNSSTKKALMEMVGLKDLKKQIGRSATPYLQEMYKRTGIHRSESGTLYPTSSGVKPKLRRHNNSAIGNIYALGNNHSKSHSILKLDHEKIRKFG